MTYKINKTNGVEIVSLNDGEIDTSTTDITLIGRNYKGFGEFLNENFVKILENFASSNAPSKPITGQLWYDTSEARLKIYDETENAWRTGGGPIVASQQPLLAAGDIWFNNSTNQMYFFDGTDLVLIGPEYNAEQGLTGLRPETVLDSLGRSKTISSLYVANQLIGIFSKEAFSLKNPISGFSGSLNVGFNTGSLTGIKWHGTSTNSEKLNGVDGQSYLRGDQNDTTSGSLRIQNNTGLTVGASDNFSVSVNSNTGATRLVNNIPDADLSIITRTSVSSTEVIKIDTVNQRVGIFNTTPTATLDVNGDVNIDGNLTVTGNTISAEVTNLEVQDKNIELSKTDSPADSIADGGGITLKGDTDHTITWYQDTGSGSKWEINDHLNLTIGNSLKMNDTVILDATRLYDSVTRATGLTEVGDLLYLNVDNLNLNGSTITSSAPLSIVSSGAIVINSQRLTSLADPVDNQDATTKVYVDDLVTSRSIGFSLDITDYPFTTPITNGAIQSYIEDLYTAQGFSLNTQARVHAITYSDPVVRELRIYRVEDIGGTNEWRHVSTTEYV